MPATFLSFDEGGYWHTFRFAAVVEGGAGAGYLLTSLFLNLIIILPSAGGDTSLLLTTTSPEGLGVRGEGVHREGAARQPPAGVGSISLSLCL